MRKFDVPEDLLLPEKSGELFFAQRVAELSYMYSRESYRVSTTTVPFLARECLAVIEDYRTLDLHISGVERVLAELKRRSYQNVIVSQLARMPLDSYFSKDINNIGSVEDAIRVFAKEMTPLKYLREACSAIIRCAPNEKEKADFIASELVCTLVNMGISQEYIYEQSVKIFFSDPPPEGASRIEIFLQKMREVEVEVPKFSAILPLKAGLSEINHSVLKLFFAETVEGIPEEFQAPAEFIKEVEGKHLLLMKGVTSLDYISAAKLIKRNIVRIHDLLGLFYHKGTNEFGPSILVARLGQPDSSVVVKCDQNLMQMISDNPRTLAARKLETMIKTLRLPRGEDSEKFFRVVEFHGMSLSSPIPENQLINLWTSLETVVPSLKGKSIIGSVCKGALPIIGIQYLSRTFLTVAKDIKRWQEIQSRDQEGR